jgi:hypothetical protein
MRVALDEGVQCRLEIGLDHGTKGFAMGAPFSRAIRVGLVTDNPTRTYEIKH